MVYGPAPAGVFAVDRIVSITDSRSELVAILQLAYSGERAAGYAYRGHARSVRSDAERERIQTIESEEWHHRELVGEILQSLGAGPNPRREVRAAIVGRLLGFLCHVAGWFVPMYGAGKLESHNIVEYEVAARLALDCGRTDAIDCILTMAEVEWEHEAYFRARVLSHPWSRRVAIWPAPAPRENIRASFPAYPASVPSAPATARA